MFSNQSAHKWHWSRGVENPYIHTVVIAQMPMCSTCTYTDWFNKSLNNKLLRLKNHEKNYSIFMVLINGLACVNRSADIMSFCQRWTNSNTINTDVTKAMRMSIFGQVIVKVLIEHMHTHTERGREEDECALCSMDIFHFHCFLKNEFWFQTLSSEPFERQFCINTHR